MYFLHTRSSIKTSNTDFTLSNYLLGSLKLTKNADLHKCKYTGYGIELILVQIFYLQMKAMEKMSLFLELI